MALRALNAAKQKEANKMQAYTTSWKYSVLEYGAECRYSNKQLFAELYEFFTTNPLKTELVKSVVAFMMDFLEGAKNLSDEGWRERTGTQYLGGVC